MKGFAIAAPLALMLGAAPVFAQTPAPQQPPPAAQPAQPPKPAAPPAPAAQQRKPAAPTAVTATPPAPFPVGAKIAFFQPEVVFQNSAEGKAALTRVQALVQK